MSSIGGVFDRLKGLDLERTLGLRASAPRVAVELDRHELRIVRLKRKRTGKPEIDGLFVKQYPEPIAPATIFDQSSIPEAELAGKLRELFEAGGIRPGRVSLVLPDNLAKIALISLPEWPPSRKQLAEIIRFKMHRAVPFRVSEASMTFQVIPGEGKSINVLVALVHQSVVERYERALESIGARPGLVDLCTPNLLNLCRGRIDALSGDGGDVGLLNCAESYFSLMIVRDARLIFFRCKTYSMGSDDPARMNGLLNREMSNSISYYQEKLGGQGIGTMLVRSVSLSPEDLAQKLDGLGIRQIERVDPASVIQLAEGAVLDDVLGQRIAAALGAANGRS